MTEGIGIITRGSLELMKDSGVSIAEILKISALAYDYIVFDYFGIGPLVNQHGIPTILAYFDKSNKDDTEELSTNPIFKKIFIPPEDFFDDYTNTRSSMLSFEIDSKWRQILGQTIEQNKLIERSYGRVLADYCFLEEFKKKAPEASGIFSPLHDLIMETLEERITSNVDGMKLLSRTKFEIPRFEKFTWKEILILRQNQFIKEFRDKLAYISTQFFSNLEIENTIHELDSNIWDLISSVVPNTKKSIWLGILGNIPLGPIPINPISVFSSISEIKKAKDLKERFGWLFFVQKARELKYSNNC